LIIFPWTSSTQLGAGISLSCLSQCAIPFYTLSLLNDILWNNFFFALFSTNVGVGQGLALSPILSAIYLALIIKTFKKRIKILKEKIPTNILSFVDDGLLISQEKSYSLFSSFLLCSYNIMSKILLNVSLVMKHNKSKYFHFMRSCHIPNPSIDLYSV